MPLRTLSFRPIVVAPGVHAPEAESSAAVVCNLKNLLLTHVGERLNQPQFGSNLRALIFEQIDDELPTKIDTEVRRATNLWLPYIVISEVNTLTEEGDNNKIVVQIKFSTSLDPQTQETISLDASYTAERV